MYEIIIAIVLVIISGAAIGLQAPIAGEMSPRVGSITTAFIIHLVGTILSGVLLTLRGYEQLHNWRQLKWYMWAIGGVGVVLYLSFAYAIPRLGAASTLVMLLIGQLCAGMLVDHLGLFNLPIQHINFSRMIALILLITGGYLMMK
jgi:transporter family-2 protein